MRVGGSGALGDRVLDLYINTKLSINLSAYTIFCKMLELNVSEAMDSLNDVKGQI